MTEETAKVEKTRSKRDLATMDALEQYIRDKVPPGSGHETMNRAKLEFILDQLVTNVVPRLQEAETETDDLSDRVDARLCLLEEASHVHKDWETVVPSEPSPEIAAIVARLNALEKLDGIEALDLETVLTRLSYLEEAIHANDASDIVRWVGDLATTVNVLQAGVDSRPRREELISVDVKLSKAEARVTELECAQSQLERQSVIDHGVLAELRGSLDKLTSDFADTVGVVGDVESDIEMLNTKVSILEREVMDGLEEDRIGKAEGSAELREVAQILIEEIGAEGPEDAVTTAKRAASELRWRNRLATERRDRCRELWNAVAYFTTELSRAGRIGPGRRITVSDDAFEAGLATPIKDSGKALLVDLDGVGQVWVPHSAIHDDSEVWREDQEDGLLVVKGWLADKRGWR